MLQIIGALFIFFFIIVPIMNWLATAGFSDHRTPEQKQQAKQAQQSKEKAARIKQLEWHIKRPYIFPGIFGFFCIMASSTSPYVNHMAWYVMTLLGVLVVSLLYQQLLKSALRKTLEQQAV